MPYVYETDGPAIYRESFATIRREAALSRFSPEAEPVAVRMIHAAGLVALAEHVHFRGDVVNRTRRALEAGAPILCDARMVAEGITRQRLPANNAILCTLHDERVPGLAREMANTRSAAALELWRPYLDGAVVAIGNAPTALFHLLNMLESPDCPRPAPSSAARWASSVRRNPSRRCGECRGALRHRRGSARRQRGNGGRRQRHGGSPRMMRRDPRSGTIFGVGLGPGSQDLMSVRADRLIRGASHVAYFRKKGRTGHARRIVDGMLAADAVELPMEYPVTTEIPFDDPRYNEWLAAFYERQVAQLDEIAGTGHDVVVLCEGDPFFYGSFMHLYTRLMDRVPVEVVPGITGMSAAWTATGQPITWGDDVLTVLTATQPEAMLAERIARTDAWWS